MSQYLEAAAALLKKAEIQATSNLFGNQKAQELRAIARGYAELAAIDKGLLPDGLAQDLIDHLARRYT
ncbi:hypothetical protein ABZ502_09285 [Streptomyces abikoensis]|uniref:hypothetical protein n=1 Tax=Streptomyces abikoensis TaxID=97398 RepID=UPI0033C1AF7D